MAKLKLVGSGDLVEGTVGHPIFSLDRAGYVPLGSLLPGEHVRTADGWAIVESLARSWDVRTVYNLEVETEHRYYVGQCRVESHNAGGCDRTYVTYTKAGPNGAAPYSGRASGKGTPQEILGRRDGGHEMNALGFGPARIDKVTKNKDAWRGREQQLIQKNGGAQSSGGTSGNAINGVSPRNQMASDTEKPLRRNLVAGDDTSNSSRTAATD
ncbi:MAG: hypothetical protein U0570_08580 [Phycisphaerales bacterium]